MNRRRFARRARRIQRVAGKRVPRPSRNANACAPLEAAGMALQGMRMRRVALPTRAGSVQTCGTNDPTSGSLRYDFAGTNYYSPSYHASPTGFVKKAKPTMPCYVPYVESGVKVWQGWVYGSGGFHSSVDYGYGQKTFKVRSIAPGKVVFVDWHPWHGNVVIIEHRVPGKDPFRSMYFHLRNGKTHDLKKAKQTKPSNWSGSDKQKAENYKKYADLEYGGATHWGTDSQKILVKVGDRVGAEQQIGWAGNTGPGGASAMLGKDGKPTSSSKTNIHLHFMIAQKDGGKWYFVDPYGAYSQSTSCYQGTGKGLYAHWFAPLYPYYHNADAGIFQEAFDYYAQMGWGPTDFTFHPKGSSLRVSGIFQPSPEPFAVRFGMTSSSYDQFWKTYKAKGFRPHKQSFYLQKGNLRIACIWRPNRGEGWYSWRNLTDKQFHDKVVDLMNKGYRLTDYCVYPWGSSHRIAGIWVKQKKPHSVWYGMDLAGWQKKFSDHKKAGYALTHFLAYQAGSATRYGGIWTKGIWSAYYHLANLTASGFQQKFNFFAARGYRLVEVVGYRNSSRFAGLWVKGVKGYPQLH